MPSIRLDPGASSARSTRRGVSPSLSPPPHSLEKKGGKKGCRLRGERNFSGIVNRYLYHRTPTRPRTILERSAYQPGVKTRFNTLAHLPAPFHDEHRRVRPFSLSLSLLSLPSRSSWHPFYAHTSPREMANMEDAVLPFFPYLGPGGETDGTIANDRSRFIEYVSAYCSVPPRSRWREQG